MPSVCHHVKRSGAMQHGMLFGFALGVNKLGRFRNEYTRRTAQVGLETKSEGEIVLVWTRAKE